MLPAIFPAANTTIPSVLLSTQIRDGNAVTSQNDFFIGLGQRLSLWMLDGPNFWPISKQTLPEVSTNPITDLYMNSNRTYALATTDSRVYLLSLPSLAVVDSIALPGSLNQKCHSVRTVMWVRPDESAVYVLPRFGCQLMAMQISTGTVTSLSVIQLAEFDPLNVGIAEMLVGSSPDPQNRLNDTITIAASNPYMDRNDTMLRFSQFNSSLFDIKQTPDSILFDSRELSANVIDGQAYYPEWNGVFFTNCRSLTAFDFGTFNTTAVVDLRPAFGAFANDTRYNNSCALFIGAMPLPGEGIGAFTTILRCYFAVGPSVVSFDLPPPKYWRFVPIFQTGFTLLTSVFLPFSFFLSRQSNLTLDLNGYVVVITIGVTLFIVTALFIFVIIVSNWGHRSIEGEWDSLSD